MQLHVQAPLRQLHAFFAVAVGKLLDLIIVGFANRVERPRDAFLGEGHHANSLADKEILLVLGHDPLDDLAVREHQISFWWG